MSPTEDDVVNAAYALEDWLRKGPGGRGPKDPALLDLLGGISRAVRADKAMNGAIRGLRSVGSGGGIL